MKRLALFASLTFAVVGALVAPARAQEASPPVEDWVVTALPAQKTTAAVAAFTSGLGIIARCQNGVYDVIMAGLPEAPRGETTRDLGVAVGDAGEIRTTVWTVGSDRTTAFSRLPAIVARSLAKGGKLQIVVSGNAGERRTRYVMALNPSSTAIEQTLSACGRPLVDLRDDRLEGNGQSGLPSYYVWVRPPFPLFPDPVAGRSITEGYVALSCVTQTDGRLADCQVESEQPPRFNLSRHLIRSLDNTRVGLSEEGLAKGATVANHVVAFTVNFRME